MDIQGKVWGTTAALLVRPAFSIHLLEINAGGFSSEHRHERKLNHFYVVRGVLEILQWPANGGPPDTTELKAGDSLTIQVGVWHQFKATTDALVLETYESAPVEDDIERRTHGGVDAEKEFAGLP